MSARRYGYGRQETGCLTIVGMLGGVALAWLFSAWVTMIVVGIAHHDWWPLIPTMRYQTALLISSVYIISAVVSALLKAIIGGDK